MPKTKKVSTDKRLLALWIVIAVLLALCSFQAYLLNYRTVEKVLNSPNRIVLGSMQYKIENNKAILRSDEDIRALEAFLVEKASSEGCLPNNPAHEYVTAWTKDESQVLLKYGCGSADSPMYIVKVAGKWKSISPTNHFDTFGIPECTYLDEHAISKEIAPVCVNNWRTESPSYSVR